MKTSKEILYEHATKNNDGFLSGQVKWIVEAMEEYRNQEVNFIIAEMQEEIKNIRDNHKEQMSDAREAIRYGNKYYK